jgi:hypothetical protein
MRVAAPASRARVTLDLRQGNATMADERRTHAGEDGPVERTADPSGPPPPAPAAARGGAWLTYRYRFGREGAPEATGTIKAPSFLTAARRILDRGLGATVGAMPAYLRLRAAGEQEVLFRVVRTGTHGDDALHVEVAPAGTHAFAGTTDPPAAADDESPSS